MSPVRLLRTAITKSTPDSWGAYQPPAHRVVADAHAQGATRIVLPLDRAARRSGPPAGASIVDVVRAADLPVLALSPAAPRRFTRVMIVAGLGDASVHAARSAAELVREAELVALVQLRTWDAVPADAARFGVAPGDPAVLAPIDAVLALPASARVERVALAGGGPRALVAFAEARGIELIVVPIKGRTPCERMIVKNAAIPLLEAAPCSVLVVPPAPAPERARWAHGVVVAREPSHGSPR
ncbi:MAG: universal stress protein [Gemmatimonadaceae bacterium]|nr:universal stress protein [Gemmatimonadaceae bacterium]